MTIEKEVDLQDATAALSDGLEGVMTLVQLLVLSLQRQGLLDTQAFAQDLLAFRKDAVTCPPESMCCAVMDRMLELLVSDRPDVLLRRAQIRVVPPTVQKPVPSGQGDL
jgi:hypothetical protein